jgi:hypothetical protein
LIPDGLNYSTIGETNLMYVVAVEVREAAALKVFKVNTFTMRQDV